MNNEGFVSKVHPVSGHVHFAESDSHRPLLFKANSILPVVSESALPRVVNTANLRKSPIELWVLPNSNGSASGELFFDDGESIETVKSGNYNLYDFRLSNCHLTLETVHLGYKALAGSQDILTVNMIRVALGSTKTINNENLNVRLIGRTNLIASIEGNTLNIHLTEGLNLLTSKGKVSIEFKNKHTGECFTH